MTDIEDIKKDLAELRLDLKAVAKSIQSLETSRAVADERQIETSKKIDLLTMTIANNYTSAVEFGQFKMAATEKIGKLENWLTWILRLIVATFLGACLAALRIKGGI